SGDNATEFDAEDYLVSANIGFSSYGFGLAQEVLGADDDAGRAFATPLATLHKFQGWADLFLATPAAGIEDTYVTFTAGLPMGMSFMAMYHVFEADGETSNGES